MKGFKRLLAGFLASAMVLGSCLTSMAADSESGSATGDGDLEAFVNTDVFEVTAPVITAADLRFIMDPQGLLGKADNTTFDQGAGGVYFMSNSTNKAESNEFVVSNNSSFAVNVQLNITVNADGVTGVSESTALATAKTPSLYIEVQDSSDAKLAGVSDNATVSVSLSEATYDFTSVSASEYGAHTASYNDAGYVLGKSGLYAYAYKSTTDASSQDTESFKIVGKCSEGGDWSKVTSTSTLEIAWTITKYVEYNELTGYKTWSGSSAYLAASATEGFASAPTKIEISQDGSSWVDLTITAAGNGWYSVPYSEIATKITDGAAPYTIRVIVGTDRYTITMP